MLDLIGNECELIMMNDSFKLIVECYHKRVKGLKLVRQNIEMFKSMNDLVGMKDTILLYNRLVMTLNVEINVLKIAEKIGYELPESVNIDSYYRLLDSEATISNIEYQSADTMESIQDRMDSIFAKPFELKL